MTEELVGRGVIVVAMLGSGVLMLWMARATASGRLGRNPIAGIRTRDTLASDAAWLAAHRRTERLTVAAAWCSIAAGACAALPLPMPAVLVVVLAGAVAMIVLTLRAAAVGSRAARAAAAQR